MVGNGAADAVAVTTQEDELGHELDDYQLQNDHDHERQHHLAERVDDVGEVVEKLGKQEEAEQASEEDKVAVY